MDIENREKLNQLLKAWQPGRLFFSSWLKKHGYSDQLMQQYRKSGWFSALSKGVMYRTGDKLSFYAALSSYNMQLDKRFYIGAHSALELFGFNHYVSMGKPLMLVGHPQQNEMPRWMLDTNFEYELKFFSTNVIRNPQFVSIDKGENKILTSVPEQAFLECLLLAPARYDYMDLFYIMEQLTTLRSDVVQFLLENTNNIKAKRMFLYMAQKAGHDWLNKLDREKINLGTGKESLVKNGVYVPEFKITIPKELNDYE